MNKKPVVFVLGIRGFPFVGGGAEKHSEELYPRLAKKGYDITALVRYFTFPEWKGVKMKKLPYLAHTSLETISHSAFCTVYCLIKRPDLIHIHNMGACLFIPILLLAGLKVMFTVHSINYHHKKWGFLARFILNLGELIGINCSHTVITVSEDLKNYFHKKYNRKVRLHYINNAVGKPERVYSGLTLKKYTLKPKEYILAVGRLVPEKGFDNLIKAYKVSDTDAKLVIVGDGDTPYAKELKRNKSAMIVFTGYICGKELAEVYTNAGLFVSSSYSEGFPIVFLEALSYEISMLVSNIPANNIIPLPTYRYYHQENVEELAGKMTELINVDYSNEQKVYFRHMLENEYDWEAVTEKTFNLYEKATKSFCGNSSL